MAIQIDGKKVIYLGSATIPILKGDKGDKGDTGENGLTPYIKDGIWYIGTESTGIRAEANSIVSIDLTNIDNLTNEYTITFSDKSTYVFYITNGKDGDTPYIKDGIWYISNSSTGIRAEANSISKIELINTNDLIDEYKITFSDNTTYTYSIKNGKDGVTPYIEGGIWYVDGVNTGIRAEAKSISNIELSNSFDTYDEYTITFTDNTIYIYNIEKRKRWRYATNYR